MIDDGPPPPASPLWRAWQGSSRADRLLAGAALAVLAGVGGAVLLTGEDEDRPVYETTIRAISVVDELLSMTSPSDSKYQYLLLLRHQLEVDERQSQEAQKVIAEYDEAYNKLTSPANRLATYLGEIEGEETVQIAMGDQEFIANVDPKIDREKPIEVGDRVRVNDAYAVLAGMGPHPSGPVVKIAEVLADGRLRVSMDSQGMNSRVVGRSQKLQDIVLKQGDEVRM